MTYDAARQRVVLFAGWDELLLSDLWEWDGRAWLLRKPAQSPLARCAHALAYDEARQRVVLFGGYDRLSQPTVLGDTWEWDGTSWAPTTPANGPAARALHALAYDATRRRVVMFGGFTAKQVLADTWEWDGTSWLQRTPVQSPSARSNHVMAYDAARQRVVLFGGVDTSGSLGDTWEWDGTTWLQRSPATNPPPERWQAMVYDATRRRCVLLASGEIYADPSRISETWEWDGTSWTPKRQVTHPQGAEMQAMCFDPASRTVLLFGGINHYRRTYLGDTWSWDGTQWSRRMPLASPSPRLLPAMATDAGFTGVVLFGGGDNIGVMSDTWTWDGSTWSLRSTPVGLLARNGHAMTHDLVRRRVVLFGGADWKGTLGDTWEWDGATWLQGSSGPPARQRHAMAYSLGRRRVVLFGGGDGSTFRNDTWEWDGSTWRQATPATSPPRRWGHTMATDPARPNVVVMFGGSGPNHLGDTWEWDGASWTQVSGPAPSPRVGHAMTSDPVRQRIVLAGGLSHFLTPLADTWLFGFVAPAKAQPNGTGCPAPTAPLLTTSDPYLANDSLTLELHAARASSACAIGLAVTAQDLALGGGCSLYLKDPVLLIVTTTNAYGSAMAKLAVPAEMSLRGLQLQSQAFVADPRGPVLGLAFTNGYRLTIGD
jgi:hypothetical protein